jgi:hypothetical protein
MTAPVRGSRPALCQRSSADASRGSCQLTQKNAHHTRSVIVVRPCELLPHHLMALMPTH